MRVVAALLLVASFAHADPTPKPPPVSPLKATPEASLSPLKLSSGDLDRIEHRARTRRAVGIGLAVPGIALLVLGAVVIGIGSHDTRVGAAAIEIATGAVGTASGAVLTLPGAYLWVSGQDGIDTVAWRRQRQ
jgi:hypothetical protein